MNKTLEPADIRDLSVRKKVIPAIQSICKRFDAGTDELDVYHSLASGESVLYLNEDGFLVLRQDIDRYTREKILFVWFAYAFKQGQNFLNSQYLDWLITLSQSVNADRMEFCAPRAGYEKALPDGWKKTVTTYVWSLKNNE